MPRHIARLILLLVVLGAAGYAAKHYFTVDSFYRYGHYRGNSVAQIAADKPKFKGSPYCQTCHTAQFTAWSTGVHDNPGAGKVVKCEVCHGPGGGRDPPVGYMNVATGPDHPTNLKLVVPTDTRALCTLCHEQITGRPAQQPQIVVAGHAGGEQCTLCHNPHSPMTFIGAVVSTAAPGDATAGKAKTAACDACHGSGGVSANLPGPTLAGQSAAYLVEAFKAYQTGARSNPLMTAVSKGVSDDDLRDIAAYYATAKCGGALGAGEQAATAKATICANCHGRNGQASSASWPNLLGMSKAYLTDALKAYNSGGRRNVVMSALSKDLSEQDVDALTAYYARAGCK